MKSNLALLMFLLPFFTCNGQDQEPLTMTNDAKYFHFWEGTWLALKDDNTLDSTTRFIVTRSIHPAAYVEQWTFGGKSKSLALRAWDKTNNKWGFTWVSDNGLYQVWDTRKVDGHWYLYKQFTVNGDTYLSRQGFLLQSDGTVLRISQKSYDEKNWETRFSQRLRKID